MASALRVTICHSATAVPTASWCLTAADSHMRGTSQCCPTSPTAIAYGISPGPRQFRFPGAPATRAQPWHPHPSPPCRHAQVTAAALAASPKLATAATNGGTDAYLEFAATKDDESIMSDERTSSATALSGHTTALALGVTPAPNATPTDEFLAMPPPPDAASATIARASDDEFLPATSVGHDGQELAAAAAAVPDPGTQGPPAAALAPVAVTAETPQPAFKLSDGDDARPPAAGASVDAPSVNSGMQSSSLRSTGTTKRLPMPVLSMSRIPVVSTGPQNSTEAAMEGPGSVPYPDGAADGNLYTPAEGGSPPSAERGKLRTLHAQSPKMGKPPLGPSPIPAASEGASWSPPPAIVTRSVHAVSRQSPDVGPPSPTSSIGDVSTYSRTGYSRSIHAQPRGGIVMEDSSLLGSGQRSPSAYSVSASVTSSVRRRMRTSLHVLPKRGAAYAASGPFGNVPRPDRGSMDPPQETAPL